jgi:hypothetical protein
MPFLECGPIQAIMHHLIQFGLNVEFLKAKFFLNGALGQGLDTIDPSLTQGCNNIDGQNN